MDTHDLEMPFGKYAGERVTRVPVGYLKWAVSVSANSQIKLKDGSTVPFAEVAKAEIERRGERLQNVEVSGHAIDRLSQKFRKIWHENKHGDEGLYSWAARVTSELWGRYQAKDPTLKVGGIEAGGEDRIVVEEFGIDWVIQTDLVIPSLITVK